MSTVHGSSAPPSAGLGHIKGAAFREFLVYYARAVDAERIPLALRDLDCQELTAAAMDCGVMQNTWYRAELVHDLLDRLTEGKSDAELAELAQRAANHIMDVTLRGVYKALFSLIATPDRYARHIEKLWRVHYDNGDPATVACGPREHHTTFIGWKSHHPFICRLNMSSALPIYGAMGCRGVEWRRAHCKSLGGEHCTAVITWKSR